MNNKIKGYYKSFLGKTVFEEDGLNFVLKQAKHSDRILNSNYYYPLIMTTYNSQKILSFSENEISYFISYLNKTHEKDINKIISCFFSDKDMIQTKIMYRMTTCEISSFSSSARCLIEDDKKLFLNSGSDLSIDKREKKWQKILPFILKGRCFIYEKNQKIVSIAHISDIQCGGANIVVVTDPKEQGNGYAKHVVAKAINWSVQHNVLPIYFVDSSNFSSLKLAQKLNFKSISSELVISKYYEENN